jgi:hypothetical protein
MPSCEVHTFDHTITLSKTRKPAAVNFHSWGLGAEVKGDIKTLEWIRERLGHGAGYSLEILKVDIEGAGTHAWSLQTLRASAQVGLL